MLLGLLPWILGKYVLCPLRWRALTSADLGRRWYLRAYAESELLGLLTPGHVGADVWRMHRLTRAGLRRGDALASVGTDRLVGALGLAAFVASRAPGFRGGCSCPPSASRWQRWWRCWSSVGCAPSGCPPNRSPGPASSPTASCSRPATSSRSPGCCSARWPPPDTRCPRSQLLGAFGASQIAGAVPGPNGASPRDAALVVALAALGVPWAAAAAAVALKAAVAWLPGLALGGASLVLARRAARRAALAAA